LKFSGTFALLYITTIISVLHSVLHHLFLCVCILLMDLYLVDWWPWSKRQRTPKTIHTDDTPGTFTKKNKQKEQDVTKEKVTEKLEGLDIFLQHQEKKLRDLWDQAKGQRHIVLLQLHGPRLLEIPSGFESLVMKIVEPSRIFFGNNQDWSRFKGPLADHIWCLKDKAPAFFDQMSLLDPVADGNCGFTALQLFGMFLEGDKETSQQDTQLMEAVRDTNVMCQFIKDNLNNDIDYFKSSKIIEAMSRWPGIDGNYSKKEGEASPDAFLNTDLEKTSADEEKDSLLDILQGKKKMDRRHLEVFAKATKTRIVFLYYWLPHKEFTCLDIDWRDSVRAPAVKFYENIPDFGDGYDFSRTAVIMNAPTSVNVKGDNVIWNGDHRHFSLWLPHGYDPCKTKHRGSTEAKQSPPDFAMVDDPKMPSLENPMLKYRQRISRSCLNPLRKAARIEGHVEQVNVNLQHSELQQQVYLLQQANVEQKDYLQQVIAELQNDNLQTLNQKNATAANDKGNAVDNDVEIDTANYEAGNGVNDWGRKGKLDDSTISLCTTRVKKGMIKAK